MRQQFSERDVVGILEADGPLTGAELIERTRMEALALWRLCRLSLDIRCRSVARRYVRLDRMVGGYARLSPSIRREFLTYTLIDAPGNDDRIERRAVELGAETERISREKFELARDTMASVLAESPDRERLSEAACFFIAGDVTYGMAHRVPRPERSTGELVRGSDLDVVVVAADDLPEAALKALDGAIHRRKFFLLQHPAHREEIDYVVKRASKVHEQLAFDDLHSMIACKIMWEGEFLCGNEALFGELKTLLETHGIPGRLSEMEALATRTRAQAEEALLEPPGDGSERDYLNLFYTTDEGDEIA